jgi:Tol biopolymer transport system component
MRKVGLVILNIDLSGQENSYQYNKENAMKKNSLLFVGILFVLVAMATTACSSQVNAESNTASVPTPTSAPAQKTYSDPFEYCAAVGTIDSPDTRYSGPEITDAIINGYKVAASLEASTMPMEIFMKTTTWRCMDNQVYACNFGANLPCSSKANTDKTPTQAMEDYCAVNPDSDFIPMSVTGHSTIYSFHCVNTTPELLDQIENVDAAGYLAQIWYPIDPNAPSIPTPTPEPTEAPTSGPTQAPISLGGSDQILFTSNRSGDYDDLYLLDFTSSQVTRLTQGDSNTFPGPFSPDGIQILFTGYELTNSYVGLMNADGSNPVDLTQAEVDEGFPNWSPNGKQIAFTSRRDGNNEIYVMNANGSQPKRLTDNPHDDFAPAWSPDGHLIAFVSDRDHTADIYSIYLMNADGSKVTRLGNDKGSDYTPNWSPDGKQIVFRSSLDGTSDIYVVNIDGSGLRNLTNNSAEDWSPAWSPDGSLIVFQTNRDGNWEIYAMNADGTDPQNLTNNPTDDQMPYWAPPTSTGIANPASVNCLKQGGTLAIEKRGEMGDFGVCYFEDNRQCEEWALFRGECPVGGFKVTGYITDAARFCAITGGEYAVAGNSGADNEQGTCTFKTGKSCDAWEYYNGKCSPND